VKPITSQKAFQFDDFDEIEETEAKK